jgi:hypothetical protein
MKKTLFVCFLTGLSVVLAACGPSTAQTAAPATQPASPVAGAPTGGTVISLAQVTPSADMCSPANLPDTVNIVNTYMVQFDNYATLASTLVQSQLPRILTAMQGIRDALQAQAIPDCLTALKTYGRQYMDAVIKTLEDFKVKPDSQSLAAGILKARSYSDQYAAEKVRLLGLPQAGANGSPAPGSTEAAGTPAPAGAMIINPGPNPLNLHVSPSLTSQSIGVLNASDSAPALGRSSNGEWVQIEVPGQVGKKAWVYASLVQYISGDPNTLPVATP